MIERRKLGLAKESADKSWGGGGESYCGNEENFQRLIKSGILMDFVTKNNGSWDHAKWLGLCNEISEKGYTPIDSDQVGLALERERANYFAKKK